MLNFRLSNAETLSEPSHHVKFVARHSASVHHQFFSQRYQAVYNYLPRNEDELELKEGDIVDVMEKCDDGWFVGKRGDYMLVFYYKNISCCVS